MSTPRHPSFHRPLQAFTLIELLVVISIIALLAAMLLPTMSLVRAQARATTCMAHIRQLPLAVELYATINDGQLVLTKLDFGNAMQWETLLAQFVPEILNNDARIESTSLGNGQVKSSVVRGCAEFRTAVNPLVSVALNWTSGYGFTSRPLLPASYGTYNWKWSGSGTDVSLVQVQDKAKRIAFGDSDDWWMTALGAGPNYWAAPQPRIWEVSPNRTSGMVKSGMEAYVRHRGRANYAFFDGHAERLRSPQALDAIMDPANTLRLNY